MKYTRLSEATLRQALALEHRTPSLIPSFERGIPTHTDPLTEDRISMFHEVNIFLEKLQFPRLSIVNEDGRMLYRSTSYNGKLTLMYSEYFGCFYITLQLNGKGIQRYVIDV